MSKKTIKIGDAIFCDLCNKDWTNDNTSGGFYFGGHSVCPDCADNMLKSIKEYDEEEYIVSFCPKDKSFSEYVRQDLRGDKPGEIVITSW